MQPYSVADFFSDAKREFAFLKEMGYVLASTQFTGFSGKLGIKPLMSDPVERAGPILRFEAPGVQVTIAHDPRAEVQVSVSRLTGDCRSATVEEIVRTSGVRHSNEFGGIYDRRTETPRAVLARLANGLRKHGEHWLVVDNTVA
jgi:hypothetical protein